MNTITTEVQQVTTHRKAKTTESAEQDKIHEAVRAWVEMTNEANVRCMHHELTTITAAAHEQDTTPAANPICQTIVDCEITLTMDKLLNLVPRFCQAMETRMRGVDGVEISTNSTEPNTGPSVMNHQNLAIKVVLYYRWRFWGKLY